MERKYDIVAKPTKYRNIEYRSRLEARWAVFFDTLHIKYKYEWKDYLLYNETNKSYIPYRPDFWLKDWVIEIKPTKPTSEEYWKAKEVSNEDDIAIIAGTPSLLAKIYTFSNGELLTIRPNKLEVAWCFARGLDIKQWTTLKRLSIITGKRNFNKAFYKAERYRF